MTVYGVNITLNSHDYIVEVSVLMENYHTVGRSGRGTIWMAIFMGFNFLWSLIHKNY